MSAFIVSDSHIDALLTFAKDGDLPFIAQSPTKTDIGRVLLKENIRSVAHRYPNDTDTVNPNDYEFRVFWPFVHMPPAKKAAWVLKACACFDYQACETDDYEQSVAHKIIRAIEAQAINSLPHYESAPWCIEREESR